jgi:hypothetical protein
VHDARAQATDLMTVAASASSAVRRCDSCLVELLYPHDPKLVRTKLSQLSPIIGTILQHEHVRAPSKSIHAISSTMLTPVASP